MTEAHEHIPEFANDNPDEMPVLRCNRCGKPITPETAVLTPTGYRCQDCIRQQQKVFDTTKGLDVVIGFLISGLIAFAGSWFVPRLGFFTILIAPGLGTLIYKAVRLAVKQRRSKALNSAILAGALIGSLPLLLPQMLNVITMPADLFSVIGNLTPLIWRVVYTVLVATTAYAQTKGIRL
jgi:DNA-directed RNA polymerase subunit RPC12/RpoP